MALEDDTDGLQTEIQPQADRRSAISDAFAALEDKEPTGHNVSRETNTERSRDETGKFAAKTSAPVDETKAGVQVQAAGAPAEEPVWKRPPASWKKDCHDVWASADPRLQQYAYQREEQMRSGVEPLLPKAKLADAITQAAEPYMNTIRGMGIDLPTAVEGLMKADHQLRTLPAQQKLQYLAGLARSYGIDLASAMGQAPQPGQQPTQGMDPNFYALQNELNSVRGEITSWKQAQEAAQEAQTLGEINKFAPTVEHFEEVRPTMIQLLQSGVVDNLPDAYKKAIRLNDELFQAEQQRTQTQAAQAKSSSADKAAKAAKAAAVSPRSSTPGATKTTNAKDRRSVIAEQLDNLSERF